MINTKIPMNQMIKKMTKKELLQEYSGVVNQMNECSFGRYELYYREAIEQELGKRNIEPHIIFN